MFEVAIFSFIVGYSLRGILAVLYERKQRREYTERIKDVRIQRDKAEQLRDFYKRKCDLLDDE